MALGRLEEAQALVPKLLKLRPDFTLDLVPKLTPINSKEAVERYTDLLRQAGLPD